MTVYEDTTDLSNFELKYTWPGGGGGSTRGQYTAHRRYREGTKRAKPSPLDPTPYTLFDLKYTPPTGLGSVRAVGYPEGTEYSGQVGNFSIAQLLFDNKLMDIGWDDNLEAIALVQAMSKMDQRDLDLGTAWAERGKTAELITGTATTAVKALRAIKRKNGRQLLDVLGLSHEGARGKGVVDAYLAYHYGMKPLLQDVSGAVQALTRQPPESWTISSRGSGREDQSWRHSAYYSVGLAFSVLFQASKSSRVTVTASQRAHSRREDLEWSLGLDNGLGTAWELTPFSFVVDWMVPIGDYLQALNSLKHYTGYVVTSSQKYTREIKIGPSKLTTGGAEHDCHFKGREDVITLSRRVSSGRPIPRIPVKDPVSLDHTAKALALLVSVTSSMGKIPRHIRY